MLTARSDGTKLRPFILLPRIRPDKAIEKKFNNKLQLCWAGKTFFNDELTAEYLGKIIGPPLFGKRLLAWDSYRCHISKSSKKVIKQLQIDTAVIPGGCTKFIQVWFFLKNFNYIFRLLTFIGTRRLKQRFVSSTKIG